MTDKQIIEDLINGNPRAIKEFFFVRCKPMLIYRSILLPIQTNSRGAYGRILRVPFG